MKKIEGSNVNYFINKIMFTYKIDDFMKDNEEL